MSQELVGNCGAVVGSSDYFDRLNQGAIFAHDLLSGLTHGSFPSLTYINPLQSSLSGVRVVSKTTKSGQVFSQIFVDGTKWPVFRADKHIHCW